MKYFKLLNRSDGYGYYYKKKKKWYFLSRYKTLAVEMLRKPFKTYSENEKRLFKYNWRAINENHLFVTDYIERGKLNRRKSFGLPKTLNGYELIYSIFPIFKQGYAFRWEKVREELNKIVLNPEDMPINEQELENEYNLFNNNYQVITKNSEDKINNSVVTTETRNKNENYLKPFPHNICINKEINK